MVEKKEKEKLDDLCAKVDSLEKKIDGLNEPGGFLDRLTAALDSQVRSLIASWKERDMSLERRLDTLTDIMRQLPDVISNLDSQNTRFLSEASLIVRSLDKYAEKVVSSSVDLVSKAGGLERKSDSLEKIGYSIDAKLKLIKGEELKEISSDIKNSAVRALQDWEATFRQGIKDINYLLNQIFRAGQEPEKWVNRADDLVSRLQASIESMNSIDALLAAFDERRKQVDLKLEQLLQADERVALSVKEHSALMHADDRKRSLMDLAKIILGVRNVQEV